MKLHNKTLNFNNLEENKTAENIRRFFPEIPEILVFEMVKDERIRERYYALSLASVVMDRTDATDDERKALKEVIRVLGERVIQIIDDKYKVEKSRKKWKHN